MSEFLDAFRNWSYADPEILAFLNSAGQSLTYGNLERKSNNLGVYLQHHDPERHPIVIYGHKDPLMVICIIACMKAGCPFVPLDTVFPILRIEGILNQLGKVSVLCTVPEQGTFENADCMISSVELNAICAVGSDRSVHFEEPDSDDPFYILFTSGSTGKPKGVVERYGIVDCLHHYFEKFIPEQREGTHRHQIHFDRAPFSFDVGYCHMFSALGHGHTMFSLAEEAEASLAKTFREFATSDLSLWFSTPTFLEVCLADSSFSEKLLPAACNFVVAGEILHKSTAQVFRERFPKAHLINAYGPTETGIIVTDTEITDAMTSSPQALPVGYASPFSEIQIINRATGMEVPIGESGEIYILGEQVGLGYFGDPDKTAAAFGTRLDHDGKERLVYQTGDKGYMAESGLVYYQSRYDLQVKVRGYRVELNEIEEALNALPQVAFSCILPVERDASVVALVAHVMVCPGVETGYALTRELKAALKVSLPFYMIPRNFFYHDALPFNPNGKIDRKVLARFSKGA